MINRDKNIQFIKKIGFDKVFNMLNKAPDQTTHINAYNRYISVVSEHQMFEFSERLGWSHYHQREEIYSLVELKQIILSETKVTV